MILAIVCFSLFNEGSKWRISLQVWDIQKLVSCAPIRMRVQETIGLSLRVC